MIDELLAQFYNQVKAIDLSFNWLNAAEVLIIVATMYAVYRKFIKVFYILLLLGHFQKF